MANCPNCDAKFKFGVVLRSFKPWSINCNTCPTKIKSSGLAVLLFAVVVIPLTVIFSMYLSALNIKTTYLMLAWLVLGLIVEFAYYVLLAKGIIKSNLKLAE